MRTLAILLLLLFCTACASVSPNSSIYHHSDGNKNSNG
jgi:hypothetical protein